jgi:hypothetical protein
MEEIEVRYCVNGTTCNDLFTGVVKEVQMLRAAGLDGLPVLIWLEDGSDNDGPVASAQYSQVYRIIRRPKEGS